METKMILFLLTFLCLYSGINFYLFFRAKSILHFSGFLQGLILILIILLILAPVIVRTLESLHYEQLARLAACVGYVWMAFVFLFFFSSVSLELIRIVHKLIVPGTEHAHAQGCHVLPVRYFWRSAWWSTVILTHS